MKADVKEGRGSLERTRLLGPEGQASTFPAGQEKGTNNRLELTPNTSVDIPCPARGEQDLGLPAPNTLPGLPDPQPLAGDLWKCPDLGCSRTCPSYLCCAHSPGSKAAFSSRRGLQGENPAWLQLLLPEHTDTLTFCRPGYLQKRLVIREVCSIRTIKRLNAEPGSSLGRETTPSPVPDGLFGMLSAKRTFVKCSLKLYLLSPGKFLPAWSFRGREIKCAK